jgi:cytochrome b
MAKRDRLAKQIFLPMPVWDIPTRLFHWLLPILVITSYVSVKTDRMEIHLLSGYAMAALLLFRLLWGLFGSDSARFARFLKSPFAALHHIGGLFRREPDSEPGHNAAGGWMVMLLLALLLVQVGTGLCANDDIVTEGPLAKYVGKALSDRLSGIHDFNFNLLAAAAALHIAVVCVYAIFKRQNLVRPMITGRKRLPGAIRAPRMVHPLAGLFVMLVCAALVAGAVHFL